MVFYMPEFELVKHLPRTSIYRESIVQTIHTLTCHMRVHASVYDISVLHVLRKFALEVEWRLKKEHWSYPIRFLFEWSSAN